MKKNKKRLIVMVLVVAVIMSFTVTAFAGTWSVNWRHELGNSYIHGVNKFTMTNNSVVNHGQFTSHNGFPAAIGIYNHDDGTYTMRKYWSGVSGLSAGSFFGKAGLISFATKNNSSQIRITISGTYTY